MLPSGEEALPWAETHLRAAVDRGFPKLIPAANPDGSCHWFEDGRCAIHALAPFGCAVFDAHMPADEVRERSVAASRACVDDQGRDGLYTRIWRHLIGRGLIAPPPDRQAVERAMRRLEPPTRAADQD